MQVAKEANGPSVRPQRNQHLRMGGLGYPFGSYWLAVFIDRLEITSIEPEVMLVFTRQNGVGLRARGYQNGARRQHNLFTRGY